MSGPTSAAAAARARRRVERALGVAPTDARALAAEEARACASFPALAGRVAELVRSALDGALSGCPWLVVDMPGPPRPKKRPRVFFDPEQKRIRTRNPKATRVAEARIRQSIDLAIRASSRWRRGGFEGARYVLDACYVLAEAGADFDNLLKTIDAANGLAWRDDADVCLAFESKRLARPGERPGTVLTIWAILPATNETKP
jgi:hypothetical protein